MICAVAELGGTDVEFAEACANAHSGGRVVMCQAVAGSRKCWDAGQRYTGVVGTVT